MLPWRRRRCLATASGRCARTDGGAGAVDGDGGDVAAVVQNSGALRRCGAGGGDGGGGGGDGDLGRGRRRPGSWR